VAGTLSGDAVRARIAAAVLADSAGPRAVGRFTLRPDQQRAVASARRAIARYGGALLADPPGAGKTVVALALAAPYARVTVTATAGLCAQWLRAAARAARPVAFVSLESLSRGAAPPPTDFLIVDEAHHVRTPTTRRYRTLAAWCAQVPVLLLTATPVVNRRADRDALLALVLGARAAALAPHECATLVIRRETGGTDLPRVRQLPPLHPPAAPAALAGGLQRLPPPLPAADGTAALPLVQLTLAMAWCSSLAALDAALRRREQRGKALADALREGRWPDRHALRQWIVDDDATQLAMPLLMVEPERQPPASALATLHAHLEAVRDLRASLAAAVPDDTAARARLLLALANTYPGDRLVVFCAHGETVRALFRALRPHGGVVAITGERVLAAQGRWSRDEVLRALGPRASRWRPDDPRGIRILLATDLLAEGVELQGARIVVHGDPAWTPARLEQRVGRLARPGGAREVLVAHFAPPAEAARALALARRLRHKRRERDAALAESQAAERLRAALQRWRRAGPPSGAAVATLTSTVDGFLSLLHTERGVQLVGGRMLDGRWRVTQRPDVLAALAQRASGEDADTDPATVRAIRRQVRRWRIRQCTRAAIGEAPGPDHAVRRVLRRRGDAAVRRAPINARTALGARWGAVLAALGAATGAGVTQDLQRLLRGAPLPDDALLRALESLAGSLRASHAPETTSAAPDGREAALLILRSAENQAPPRPSGSAARSRSTISLA
jgi:superfamily II DNA or RNA helicase